MIDISFTPVHGNLEYEINRLNSTRNDSYNLVLTEVNKSQQINYTQFSKTGINVPPSDGPLNQHFIQYIASIMFGHPQAQAPIKNDANIIADLSNGNLGYQFVSMMSDGSNIRHSIIEQLINSDISGIRFDISDTDTYHPYPFIVGDRITFRVSMSGNLYIDSPSAMNDVTVSNSGVLSRLFTNIPGISMNPVPRIDIRTWKVIITLV